MDGTLLDENGNMPEGFFDIFKQLKKKDIIFAAASGRQYYNLLDNFDSIKDEMMFIAENGTLVMDKGRELYSNFLCNDDVQSLVKLSRQVNGAYTILCGKKTAYIEDNNPKLIHEVEKYYSRYKVVTDLLEVEDDILKFTLCDFKDASKNSNGILHPLYKDKLRIIISGYLWLDLVNNDVNKGTAIKSIQQRLNISPKETMVFGDYFNDVEMLQSAYHSYAMENAPEGVKRHARFTARSNKDKGVLQVIKKLIL
jgi:Cof subfamily protein (haloacid dehalogenase superfamily)